jgi:hypothetical protein
MAAVGRLNSRSPQKFKEECMKVKALGKIGLAITKTVGKTKLWTRIHKPEILIGVGVVAGVAAVVTAAVQGTKCADILKDLDDNLEKVEAAKEYAEIDGTEYTEEEQKRDRTVYRVQAALKIGQKMIVPAVLGTASVICTMAGFAEEKRRYTQMAGAFVSVCGTFAAYRGRCRGKFGEAADKYCLTGLDEKEIEVTSYDENGKAVVEKKTVNDGEVAQDFVDGLFTFEFSPRTSTLATNDVTTNLNQLNEVKNAAHIHMVEYWYTDFNWIKDRAQLDRKLYPPTGLGAMFGATCKNNSEGYPIRKIEFKAHAIPGRTDGAVMVEVCGMMPMTDPNKDILNVLGEAGYVIPVFDENAYRRYRNNYELWKEEMANAKA